ncbi:MAG: NAD-dependent epimerase/dehydratase family protein [Magnetococcales bacterium]|nr:NAD-dependent epimerase/dehydratase family protein [Magnetococcales bacterium]
MFKQKFFIQEDLARIYPILSRQIEPLFEHTLLVTGGVGFMGSWVCELVNYLNEYENAKIKLCIVDRDKDFFVQRLPHLAENRSIEWIGCDVRSLTEIPSHVNYIIHAAATPDHRFHASSPIETMTTIADGTACILRAANRVSNLIKFVNVSASAIYASNPQVERISETSPGLPLSTKSASAYAEAKRYAEVLCASARSEARMPIITVRPFTFCGAYQHLDSPWVINNFINDALNHRPIRILGDGKSVRSLMYGADLAYWLLVVMLHGNSGQVFNIGNDQGESVADLAKRVAGCFFPTPNILTNTALTGVINNSRLVPDVTASRKYFGLDIYTDTMLAISRSIDWYQASLVSGWKMI